MAALEPRIARQSDQRPAATKSGAATAAAEPAPAAAANQWQK